MRNKIKKRLLYLLIGIVPVGLLLLVSVYFNIGKNGGGQLHFSVDDTIAVFQDLTNNNRTSIFENEMLGFMKECHEEYGAKFSLYCYYETEEFNLSMVPDVYKEEFIENSDWLRFGFHYKNGLVPTDISADEIARDYDILVSELNRITGGNICSTVRLSYFKGSYEVVSKLRQLGVTCLLTADDDRISYYFNDEINDYIDKNDSWFDNSNQMRFVSTDMRLDELNAFLVLPKLIMISLDDNQNDIITVFTHEWLMGEEMYHKIANVCKFAQQYNYEWTLLEHDIK